MIYPRAVGFAAGLDYRLTPDTVAGFALAGSGTDWSLAQGLGGGKSDAFQAGLSARPAGVRPISPRPSPSPIIGCRPTASPSATTANFNAQSYGGRIESGYRFA